MIPKKRIAICISGQLRTWRKSIGSWRGLIDNEHDVDVFVHTWDFNTTSAKLGNNNISSSVSTKEITEFSKEVKAQEIIVDSSMMFSPSSSTQALQNPAHLSQFYGILMASRLKRKKELSDRFIYDLVIRLRPDLYFDTSPKSILNLSEYQAFNGFGMSWNKFSGNISDLFWISDSYFYDIIADFYLNLNQIEKTKFDQIRYDPGHVLFFYLKKNSIPVMSHKWKISIMRDSQDDAVNFSGPIKDVW